MLLRGSYREKAGGSGGEKVLLTGSTSKLLSFVMGQKRQSCEKVWFYLGKINSAHNFIIILFLETLTLINIMKIWKATKCLFCFQINVLISKNTHFSGWPGFPLLLDLLIFKSKKDDTIWHCSNLGESYLTLNALWTPASLFGLDLHSQMCIFFQS